MAPLVAILMRGSSSPYPDEDLGLYSEIESRFVSHDNLQGAFLSKVKACGTIRLIDAGLMALCIDMELVSIERHGLWFHSIILTKDLLVSMRGAILLCGTPLELDDLSSWAPFEDASAKYLLSGRYVNFFEGKITGRQMFDKSSTFDGVIFRLLRLQSHSMKKSKRGNLEFVGELRIVKEANNIVGSDSRAEIFQAIDYDGLEDDGSQTLSCYLTVRLDICSLRVVIQSSDVEGQPIFFGYFGFLEFPVMVFDRLPEGIVGSISGTVLEADISCVFNEMVVKTKLRLHQDLYVSHNNSSGAKATPQMQRMVGNLITHYSFSSYFKAYRTLIEADVGKSMGKQSDGETDADIPGLLLYLKCIAAIFELSVLRRRPIHEVTGRPDDKLDELDEAGYVEWAGTRCGVKDRGSVCSRRENKEDVSLSALGLYFWANAVESLLCELGMSCCYLLFCFRLCLLS